MTWFVEPDESAEDGVELPWAPADDLDEKEDEEHLDHVPAGPGDPALLWKSRFQRIFFVVF